MESTGAETPLAASDQASRVMLAVAAVIGHAAKHLMNSAFFVLLPEIKLGLGLTNAGVGTISAVRNIAGGLVNAPAGFAADRYQSQGATTLGITIILVGIFTAAMGYVNSLTSAVIVATLGGMAITFWHPAAISALSRRFPERRGFAISLHGTGGSIGEAMGPLAVAGLILLIGWRVVFLSIGIPSVLGGVVVWLLLRRVWDKQTGSRTTVVSYVGSLRRLVTNRHILIIMVMVMLYGGAQSALFTFLPIYIREDVGYSPSVMNLFIAAMQVSGIFSQPAMGYLSDRYGRKQVLLPGLLGLTVTTLGISVVPAGVPLFLTIVFMGMFQFPLMSLFLASATDVAGEDVQGTVVSLVFGATIIVAGISPYVGGLLADAYGTAVVFRYGAGLGALAALVLAMQRWPRAIRATEGN